MTGNTRQQAYYETNDSSLLGCRFPGLYMLQLSCDLTVKDAFYATLESLVDQCPRRDTLLVLGDFNASTGTDRDGYETCVGPHGSGTVNQNSKKSWT